MGDILGYLKIIRKWWWVIVLLFVATVGTMLAVAVLSETQYEAIVTVQVSAPPPQEAPLYSQFGRQLLNDEIEQTRASFSELLLEGDAPYRALDALPDVSMRGSDLRDRTTVDIPISSHLLRIGVRAADPETAALLANTLVETGLQHYGQLLAQSTVSTGKFIGQELEAVREELKTAEAELIQFQVTNKVGNLNSAINGQYDVIQSLRMQSDLARIEGDITKAQAIEKTIREREVGLQNMIGLSAEYTELVGHVDRARSTNNFLLDRRAEAQIKENQILESSYLQVITPARPPSRPVSAIDSKLIVLGAVVSILGGVLLTFLLEYLEISGAFRGLQRLSEQSEVVTLPNQAG